MTYIISGISIALFFISMLFIGVYNLYMFQLNVYLNNEQSAWLRSHEKRQRVLKLDYYVSLLSMLFFGLLFMKCLLIPVQLLTIWYYSKMIRKPHKKAFVWTARVKRLFFTYTIITALISGIMIWIVIWTETHTRMFFLVYAVISLFYALAPYLIMVTNTINHPIEIGINKHYINDARRILRSVPDMKIIGITGSYGKTSVKYYLDTLLKVKYNVLKTPGSFNTPMGVVKTIRGEMRPDTEIFLCEMGARYVKEIKEICDIVHPDDGIITSIGPQHLETFGSMENIVKTKFELADAVAEKNTGNSGNGRIFLNLDCDHIADNDEKYTDKIYYSAIDRSNDTDIDFPCYYAKNVSAEPTGTRFTVVTPDGSEQEYEMKLIGIHNVINVVGAIAIANSYDISLSDLVTAVRRLRPAPHRLQMLPHGNVTIIDDAYNSNPVGSRAAVETLGMFEGTRILVTPGMVELGEKENEYNEAFGGYAASNCDYVALVGEVHTRPIREGLIKAGFPEKKIFVGETLQEAMNFANTAQGTGHRYILLENDLSDNYL